MLTHAPLPLTDSSHNVPHRVLVVVCHLALGGAERVALTVANTLAIGGYDTHLALMRPAPSDTALIAPPLHIHTLTSDKLWTWSLRLSRLIQALQPTITISFLEAANFAAIIGRHLSRTTTHLTVTIHKPLSITVRESTLRKDRVFTPFLIRSLYPHADSIVAVSRGVAQDLTRRFGVRGDLTSVIPNPAVTDQLLRLSHEHISHPWLADDSSAPVLLAVGRLTKAKDYPTLLRALRLLRHRSPARLIIVGDGPLRHEMEQLAQRLLIAEHVAFLGALSNPYAYMRQASLLVLSSAWEGFANVLVEAMACGTPVVATDCPYGPREVLDHGRYGRLIPVGDAAALACAILESLRHPIASARLEQRALCFHATRIVPQYLNIG